MMQAKSGKNTIFIIVECDRKTTLKCHIEGASTVAQLRPYVALFALAAAVLLVLNLQNKSQHTAAPSRFFNQQLLIQLQTGFQTFAMWLSDDYCAKPNIVNGAWMKY